MVMIPDIAKSDQSLSRRSGFSILSRVCLMAALLDPKPIPDEPNLNEIEGCHNHPSVWIFLSSKPSYFDPLRWGSGLKWMTKYIIRRGAHVASQICALHLHVGHTTDPRLGQTAVDSTGISSGHFPHIPVEDLHGPHTSGISSGRFRKVLESLTGSKGVSTQ